MKKKFEEKESYKHLLAKNLLAKWLQDEEKDNDYCNVSQFVWRANYGVFTELKFHETSDPYYFECSEGLDMDKMPDALYGDNPLDAFNVNFNKGKILFIPDITVFHKGSVKYLIEIVHTNPVSIYKMHEIYKFFNGHTVELYQISADEILRHDSKSIPTNLKCLNVTYF